MLQYRHNPVIKQAGSNWSGSMPASNACEAPAFPVTLHTTRAPGHVSVRGEGGVGYIIRWRHNLSDLKRQQARKLKTVTNRYIPQPEFD